MWRRLTNYRCGYTSRFTHGQMAVAHGEATFLCVIDRFPQGEVPLENFHGFVKIRWFDRDFQGQYLPSLSVNYVAINTERFGKMTANEIQRNEFITCIICRRISGHWKFISFSATSFTGLFPPVAASMFVKFERNLWERYRHILRWIFCG